MTKLRGTWALFTAIVVGCAAAAAGTTYYFFSSGGSASAGLGPAAAEAGVSQPLVTRNDYDLAVDQYLACAADAGFIANSVPAYGLRPKQPAIQVPDADGVPDDDTVHAAKAVLDDCFARHLEAVSTAWNEQHVPNAEQRLDLVARMRACLASDSEPDTGAPRQPGGSFVGYDDVPKIDVDASQMERYTACGLAVEAATGFTAPAPHIVDAPTP